MRFFQLFYIEVLSIGFHEVFSTKYFQLVSTGFWLVILKKIMGRRIINVPTSSKRKTRENSSLDKQRVHFQSLAEYLRLRISEQFNTFLRIIFL